MIERINNIGVANRKNDNIKPVRKNKANPNFNGRLVDTTVKGIQKCEKNPMLNVAVIDLATAIVPRSIWESFTNIFAGFEAFRRESSGLIVNCLLPGFVALGAAKAVNKSIMGKNADLSACWAGKDSINTVADYYQNAENTPAFQDGINKFNDAKKAKVYATHYNMLADASGFDGDKKVKFGDISELNIAENAEKLTNATFQEPKKMNVSERLSNLFKQKDKNLVDEAYESIASKTHITENINFGKGSNTVTSDLKSALTNTKTLLKGFVKDGVETKEQVGAFTKKAKKLVGAKGVIAMAVIIPVAASMQAINRWITTKMSGVKGAPIYDDYAKKDKIVKTPEQQKEEKAALLKQKVISIGSMVGVACLSMMKLPTVKNLKSILEFKGQFPTMDQARAISTVTFASRMAVADDKNELAEATTRDIVTFSSMYFLGDYAAKGYASYLENKDGVKLLNRTKPAKKDSNIFKKIGNWVVNTHLKSTDELAADGVRSLEEMKHLRAKCQMANLGTSLLILGLIVPVFTRLKTEKNHKKDLLEQNKRIQNVTNSENNSNFHDFEVFKYLRTDSEKNPTFQSFKRS